MSKNYRIKNKSSSIIVYYFNKFKKMTNVELFNKKIKWYKFEQNNSNFK